MGVGYWKGELGFDVDLPKAILWLTQASEQWDVDCMMPLAMVLMERQETQYGTLNVIGDPPMPLAVNWMRKAGKLGDEEAERRAKVTIKHVMKKNCTNCGIPDVDNGGSAHLMHCAKCKVAFYCGATYQKED